MSRSSSVRVWAVALFTVACVGLIPRSVRASEFLCDPAYQDCRAPLLSLINAETVGIDVAFWFMQDSRYSVAIINRWKAGVPVRVLVDPQANPTYDGNAQILAALAAAGIPMRYRLPTAPGILHWKMMLFAGQNTVQFSGANYSPTAFVYQAPYSDYEDETPYFTDDPSIVNSFKTKYDDLWLDTTYYGNYANIAGPLARVYPVFAKDPSLNFPQQEDYAQRILKRYSAETQKIDVIMYRITDERHTNAMIAAAQRGVPVRIIGETKEYRDPSRIWVSYNMDKLYAAGIPYRVRAHAGLNHQKLVIMYGQALAVFGSSNWTTPSANQQQEHNYFTTKSWMFQWFVDQFERKWNNTAPNGAAETDWFVPLPPDKPAYLAPAASAVGVDRSLELKWDGGPWGQLYDVYFGTDPNPPLFAPNLQLGPTDPAAPTQTQKFILPLLQPGTTYYWRIVSKTMAGLAAKGAVASFTTAGSAPPPPPPASNASTIVIWTATDVPTAAIAGNWQFLNDTTAAGGRALWNPDKGQPRVSPPLASPANEFQTTFTAVAGVPYHVWLRLRAQNNSTSNNSVSFQFNDSIDQFGTPLYRIGSAQGGETILADPSGMLSGWGWADNGQGGPATLVYFPTSGTHTIQIQQRSDGAIVDQIVISPDAFLSAAPGATLNDATVYGSTIDGAAPPPPPPPPAPVPPPIPSPWQQQDIGAVGMPGYAGFDAASSSFAIEAGGADVWGTADALHFVYQPITGDGSIIARVAAVQNTASWTKVGVMIRESLAANAANAFMLVSATKGLAYQGRTATGGATSSIAGPLKAAPYWVRIDRAGTTVTGYRSTDGIAWTTVGSYSIPMATSVLVGLAVSSHNTDATAVGTFDQVIVNGAPVCGFVVSPTSQSIDPAGGTIAVSVATGAACSWTATSSNPSWLTVSAGASGKGNGTVNLSVAANAAGARTATATIAGQAVTVTQTAADCTLAITPASQDFGIDGGTTSVAVTANSWCSWTAVSSDPSWLTVTGSGSGSGTVTVAVAANNGHPRNGTVTIATQTFLVSQAGLGLPSGWNDQDVGAVGVPGSAVFDGTSFSVTGGGADVWGTADAFHYAFEQWSGDARIIARVASISNTSAWVKAGVMIRDSLDPGSAHGFMLESYSKGLAFQRRTAAGGVSTSTTGSLVPAPYWVRLDRVGDTVTAYHSSDGVIWTRLGSDTIPMAANVYVGLVVSSHTTTAAATAVFDHVSVTAPTSPMWGHQDIGTVGTSGTASFDGATTTFSVKGAGADIWNAADAFQFAYRPMSGDGVVIARVATVQNTAAWTKAGVMIRETLDANATNAFMLVSASKGLSFQRRQSTGGATVSTAGALVGAPFWVKLERIGNTFNAYVSADGASWALVGSDTVVMAANVWVGLAVSSHTTASAATATFDQVTIP